jgi:hypothetical protein
VGISFVILLGLVNLPALFALPTGLGEITAGLNGRTSSAFKHTRAKPSGQARSHPNASQFSPFAFG